MREVPIPKGGPEMGELEGPDQLVFDSGSIQWGPIKYGPYLRTSRMKAKQLLTKICFVFEMAAVPVMESCRDPEEPMRPVLFPKDMGFMIRGNIT